MPRKTGSSTRTVGTSKKEKPIAKERMVRNKRVVITLNEKEFRVIDRFFTQYKVKNKTKFLRETIIKTIWRKFEEDAPTLFSESEMK